MTLTVFLLSCVLQVAAFTVSFAETIYYWKDPAGIYHFYKDPPKGFVPRVKKESSPRQSKKSLSKRQIDKLAEVFGRRHRVNADLVRAVIEVESDYDPRSISSAGAQGLMQIMPETQKDLGVDNPFDPVENVEAGVRYLRMMLDRFKDVQLALAAYNAGPLTVEKYGGIPPFAETRKYVIQVLKRYRYNRSKARQNVQFSQ
ncbi:lytic transglycosylase domain-containing protein [Desulfovibrio mangrovi]|uniref:transglycosylase SLT domain-containing protein n=1 Tax=Desulfovibrio mangrovi TaxID=2976983 RepID=UPI002245CA28|nr:transglycosylase SLT domain-containing protein [Desulfovibrio mangrovi]UZP68268.1 lytic transglycosylase domain-containing protein [Desulfovibrio mangrovi]